MSFAVTIDDSGRPAMTFAAGNALFTNVVLSLEIRRGDFFADPAFGLRRRPRLKNTPSTAKLVKGDMEEALKWLLSTGRAAEVVVTVTRDLAADRQRLTGHVRVTGVRGNQVSYEKFVEVV